MQDPLSLIPPAIFPIPFGGIGAVSQCHHQEIHNTTFFLTFCQEAIDSLAIPAYTTQSKERAFMEQEKILQDILETVNFLKDNAVTKQEFNEKFEKVDERFQGIDRRFEIIDQRFNGIDQRFENIDHQLSEMRSDILSHVDGFISLHQKLDTEVTALRAKVERLEDQLQKVMKHLSLNLS